MTEKDYAPQKKESKKMIVSTPKETAKLTPIKKENVEDKTLKENEKKEDNKKSSEKDKKEEKKPIKTKPKVKKTEAFVNDTSIPVSTKHSIAICKFIKGKKIEYAIADLGQVVLKKKAVPMKGEIPHRKGMMSGRYPKKASEYFIKILKRLTANANVNEIDNPVITSAIANLGSRPYGKFGRVRRKRTHIKIIVKEERENKKEKKKTKKVIKKEVKKE